MSINRPDELAEALAIYERKFYRSPVVSPAAHNADYYCPNCETNVKSVSIWSRGLYMTCPICQECPSLEVIGQGPKEVK